MSDPSADSLVYSPEEIMVLYDIWGASRVSFAAAAAICIWDWLASLTSEVEFVWKAKTLFTPLNATFLLNRYGCILIVCLQVWLAYLPESQSKTCDRAYWIQPWGSIIVYIAASVIVALRVIAVWNRNKAIMVVLWGLLALQLAVQIWAVHTALPSQLPAPVNGCAWITANLQSWAYYAAMMLFDSVVLGLMLIRTGKLWRQSGISALTFVLLRDQILFFLLTFAANLANLILFTRPGDNSNEALLAPFTLVLVSIASNRILLNMRSVPASAAHLSLPKGSGNGIGARSRHQDHTASYFPGTLPVKPVAPVHHPQYPDSAHTKVSDKGSEYELEKMTV